jgi:Flp pilus assembly protein TadG
MAIAESTRHGASRRSLAAQRRRHQRLEGAAAVEFALILPLFSILLLGLIDFGHFFLTMNTITNAAREAARRASVQDTDVLMKSEGIKAANVYLTPAGLAPGGGGVAKNCSVICPVVTVTPPPDLTLTDASVTVEITIPGAFKNITGFSYKVLPGATNPFASMTGLKAVSQMRWELAPNP